MKRLLLAVALLVSVPAQAAPRWLTYLPKQVGHAYGNMLTFKHPDIAIEQWVDLGAKIFDQKTTLDSFARCATCYEGGVFLHGSRYGVGTAILGTFLETTIDATAIQLSSDHLRNDPNWFLRNSPNALFVLPTTIHIRDGIHNMSVGR